MTLRLLASLSIASMVLSAGCYTKIHGRRSALVGLPGSSAVDPDSFEKRNGSSSFLIDGRAVNPGLRELDASLPVLGIDARQSPDDSLRMIDSAGGVLLNLSSGRYLPHHILATLRADEREVFLQQVLAEHTKRQFQDRGAPLDAAYDALQDRKRDIETLLTNYLSRGDATPGMRTKRLGNRLTLVYSPAARSAGEKYIGYVQAFERGQYRLQWFVDE